MNSDNCKRIQDAVREAGAHLEGKLPPHSGLSRRNPYAHLWERIKTKHGMSYKDCPDAEVDDILKMIRWYRDNPC